MSILICVRSNWQWHVKQQITNFDFATTKGVRALKWMSNKKQQLFYANGVGEFGFIDFNFIYTTSLKSFNHKHERNLAYVCVVDNQNLNLTPLGRFVMPPPLFEK
jgi:hypothetical protein